MMITTGLSLTLKKISQKHSQSKHVAWFAGEPGSGGGKETDKEDEKEQGKNSMDMCFLDRCAGCFRM